MTVAIIIAVAVGALVLCCVVRRAQLRTDKASEKDAPQVTEKHISDAFLEEGRRAARIQNSPPRPPLPVTVTDYSAQPQNGSGLYCTRATDDILKFAAATNWLPDQEPQHSRNTSDNSSHSTPYTGTSGQHSDVSARYTVFPETGMFMPRRTHQQYHHRFKNQNIRQSPKERETLAARRARQQFFSDGGIETLQQQQWGLNKRKGQPLKIAVPPPPKKLGSADHRKVEAMPAGTAVVQRKPTGSEGGAVLKKVQAFCDAAQFQLANTMMELEEEETHSHSPVFEGKVE